MNMPLADAIEYVGKSSINAKMDRLDQKSP